MAQYLVTSGLSGNFKEVYSPEMLSLIPEGAKFVKKVPFVSREKQLGNKYHQPVVVSDEAGFTYALAGAGAFSLNNSVAMSTQDAQVDGSQIVLVGSIDYETAAKASNSTKAFAEATGLQTKNMLESYRRRLEMTCWYGQSPTGLGTTASSANASTTSTVVTLTAASFAPLVWSGRKNHQIQFYKGSDNTLVSSGADSVFTITSVNIGNRTLTVSGTTTGISALDTAILAAAQYILWNGAASGSAGTFASNECAGVDKIVTNTGSLFNIDAAIYDLWMANTYSVGSVALTFQKIISATATAVSRGLDESVSCWINPKTWANLATDAASLRRADGSYAEKKFENGFESLMFYHQNGSIEIIGHGMIKEGEGFILPLNKFMRIGAQDGSFTTPGRDDEIFLPSAGKAGYEYRLYSHQAVFCETPAKCVKMTGIVNS